MSYQITIKVFNGSVYPLEFPHAFITISGPGLTNPVTVGYYPQVTGVSGAGTVKNDALTQPVGFNQFTEHRYDQSYTFDVSPQQAMNALQFAAQVATSPQQYQLLGTADKSNLVMADGYQCTGFARDVVRAAGIQGLPLQEVLPATYLAYPGMLGIEFGLLGTSQYQPFRGAPSPEDFGYAVSKLYTGVKQFDLNDQTPASWVPPADPNPDLTPTQRNNLAAGLSASGYAVGSVQTEAMGSTGMAFQVLVYRDEQGRMVEVRTPGRVVNGGFEALGAPVVSAATPAGKIANIGIGDPATGVSATSVDSAPGLGTPTRNSASYVADTFGPGLTNYATQVNATGENFGPERVRGQLQNTIDALTGLIQQHNTASADSTQHLGLIPQRLPSLNFKAAEFADKGYAVTDIDALTGAQRYANLRFDDNGQIFGLEPASITPELRAMLGVAGAPDYPQLNAYMLNSALQRQAIAPLWEVQTAKMQGTAGDPNAGLLEEERAAKAEHNGQDRLRATDDYWRRFGIGKDCRLSQGKLCCYQPF